MQQHPARSRGVALTVPRGKHACCLAVPGPTHIYLCRGQLILNCIWGNVYPYFIPCRAYTFPSLTDVKVARFRVKSHIVNLLLLFEIYYYYHNAEVGDLTVSVSWPSALHCNPCPTSCSPGNVPTPTPAPLMDITLSQDWSATLYIP